MSGEPVLKDFRSTAGVTADLIEAYRHDDDATMARIFRALSTLDQLVVLGAMVSWADIMAADGWTPVGPGAVFAEQFRAAPNITAYAMVSRHGLQILSTLLDSWRVAGLDGLFTWGVDHLDAEPVTTEELGRSPFVFLVPYLLGLLAGFIIGRIL